MAYLDFSHDQIISLPMDVKEQLKHINDLNTRSKGKLD
jgi:hypothetical protein